MLSKRHLALALAFTMGAVLGSVAPVEAAKDYRAERYDVAITVEPGGGLVVTERIRFAFGNDSFTKSFRGLPTRRIDGLTITDVSMDGQRFVPGDDPGEYEISKNDGKRQVVWHFAAVTASSHVFELTYRVAGVVRFEAAEDLLEWNVLPTSHEYTIDCASLALTRPDGAGWLEPPSAQPGPAASIDGNHARFDACGFPRNAGWLLRARFEPRSIVTAPADWQRRAAQARGLMPLLAGLGGMLLIAGVGGFLMFGLNHRSHVRSNADVVQTAPPDSLPPNLGAALTKRGGATWPDAFATIMGLAERGVIRIEQSSGALLFKKPDFAITPAGPARSLRKSEQALYDLLFTHKGAARASVKFSELGRVFGSTSRWKSYAKAVELELRERGCYDREREHMRTRVTIAGVFVMVAGFLGLVAAVPFVREYGGATLSFGIALLAAGITGIATGQSLTPFTDEAESRAAQWQAYGRHLKGLAKSSNPASAETFAATLPLAVAFGAGLAWTKALQKSGLTAGPAWLRVLPSEDSGGAHMAATIAMLSSGHSAGHSVDHASSGVSAGGAAGGGTSGAS